MDVVQAVSGYIARMMTLGDGAAGTASAKMKILLLDAETMSIISTATTQSALLNHDVYLTDRLDNRAREKMRHLKCLCFIRPNPESIQFLIDELREPRYGEYNIYFSNILKKSALERLAEADDHEIVRAIQEHFADYEVINPDLMALDLSCPRKKIWGSTPELWNPDALQRSTEGVLALLLSLKKKPMIRYAKNSLMAKKLASEVRYQITQEEQLFEFRTTDTPPVLLILDRREDPLTPLLTQWTYQAMVHELIGIKHGRVDLRAVPDIRPELQEIVLSQDQDPFFKKNMYANFGDLGQNAKDYVEQFASKSADSHKLESITDMKRFVEDYPEFRKLSGNVSKHVTLVGELSRRVGTDSLLDVSELEQSLSCSDNHTADLRTLQQLIGNPAVPEANKLRLVAIYALRYANHNTNSIPMLLDLLGASTTLLPIDIALINKVLAFARSLTGGNAAAAAAPIPDLFSQPTAILSATRTRIQKGLKGVENVYTQHSPALLATLESLIRGRLPVAQYPVLDNAITPKDKPQDIIVFMVGGATYEEAKVVAQINASTPGIRVVLGGTSMINSEGLFTEVGGAMEGWPELSRALERSQGGAKARLGREIGKS